MSIYRERRRGDRQRAPQKNGGRPRQNASSGSWIIDITLPEIGRLKLASGVNDKETAQALVRMFKELANHGELEPIRRVREGDWTPLKLYEAHRTQRLAEALRELREPLLKDAVAEYLERPTWMASPEHRYEVQRVLNQLVEVAGQNAKLSQIPEALEQLCADWLRRGRTAAWNHARVYALRFVRHMAGGNTALVERVGQMDRAKHERTERFRLKPAQALRAADLLRVQKRDEAADAWLTMCATGMGPRELKTGWVELTGYVRILGTKNTHRKRLAPCVDGWVLGRGNHATLRTALAGIAILDGEIMAVAPPGEPKTARGKKIAETRRRNGHSLPLLPAGAVRLTPYDARRAYARWLRLAQLDYAHRRAYLGHSKNITELYEEDGRDAREEVRRDSEQFNAWVSEELAKGVVTPVRGE